MDRQDLDHSGVHLDLLRGVDSRFLLSPVFVAFDEVEPVDEVSDRGPRMRGRISARQCDEGIEGRPHPLGPFGPTDRGQVEPQLRDAFFDEVGEGQVDGGSQRGQRFRNEAQAAESRRVQGQAPGAGPLLIRKAADRLDEAGLGARVERRIAHGSPRQLSRPFAEGPYGVAARAPVEQQPHEQPAARRAGEDAERGAHRYDLRAFDEALASNNLVRDPPFAQRVRDPFDRGALPAKDGDLRLGAPRAGNLGPNVLDPPGDRPVGVLGEQRAGFDDAPGTAARPRFELAHARGGLVEGRGHGVRRVEDRRVGAEGGRERQAADRRLTREGDREVRQRVRARPAPAVDRLVGVAHRAHGPALARPAERAAEEDGLVDGGVLIFVKQH